MIIRDMNLGKAASITMGLSPRGHSYNQDNLGLPLLNGPTEFGLIHPNCNLFTTDSKRECEIGDLLFCVRGSTTGRMNWADRRYSLGRGVCSFRGKTDNETRFIRYCLETYLRELLKKSGGSTFPNLSFRDLATFEIPWPNYRDRVVEIVDGYDDLIEKNARRIAILEEMARALYQEWFVHFRFPGHEHVPLVDSSLGPVPEGWEIATLGELCEKVTDGAHHSPQSIDCDEGKPMASVKDMHDWGLNLEGCRRISVEDFEKLERNHCRPKRGDILVAKDGANLNKHTFLVTEDAEVVLLSSIAIMTPGQRVRPEFLCEQLKEPSVSKRIKGSVSGAAIPRIILKDFKKLLLIVPAMGVQHEWERLAGPFLNRCRNLVQRNKVLRTTRDVLLPKLVSGEIDVSALSEEPIAEAAD